MKLNRDELRKLIRESIEEHETPMLGKKFTLTESRFRALARSYLIINEGRLDEGFLDFLKDFFLYVVERFFLYERAIYIIC